MYLMQQLYDAVKMLGYQPTWHHDRKSFEFIFETELVRCTYDKELIAVRFCIHTIFSLIQQELNFGCNSKNSNKLHQVINYLNTGNFYLGRMVLNEDDDCVGVEYIFYADFVTSIPQHVRLAIEDLHRQIAAFYFYLRYLRISFDRLI